MMNKLDDIEWAIEFTSSGFGDHEAYIDIETDNIYYVGDTVDELPPQDLYENDKYLQFPNKIELGLGKRLAISFTADKLPTHLDSVSQIFSQKGAYSKFKGLLESIGQLESWYSHEEQALKNSVIEWCNKNSIKIEIDNKPVC